MNLSDLLYGLPEPRAVVSNLPYYITAPLVERVARARAYYNLAVLMMQREVARRIMAPPRSGDRGSISVFLQAIFEIQLVAEVPATAFLPPPKVASSVLCFIQKKDANLDESFFDFVRLGFAHPRKTLVNNLMAGLHLSREEALALVEQSGLAALSRAQELSQDEWVRLRGIATKA